MHKPKLYKKSVTILCNAYSAKTLEFGSIIASPIGNLIAANLNYSVRRIQIRIPDNMANRIGIGDWKVYLAAKVLTEDGYKFEWVKDGCVIESSWDKFFSGNARERKEHFEKAMTEINATEYSIDDLIQVDYAFQDVCKWGELEGEVSLIAGVFAAVDALREIHQVPEEAESLPVLKNLRLETSDHIVDVLEKRFKCRS